MCKLISIFLSRQNIFLSMKCLFILLSVCLFYLFIRLFTGMPFNQLGTLAGSKFYNVEATYYYLRWWETLVCTLVWQQLLNHKASGVRFLTDASSVLVSNQRPPLREHMATWSACLTKLPRCTTKSKSRRWRSCLQPGKGEKKWEACKKKIVIYLNRTGVNSFMILTVSIGENLELNSL